tara:strand:+ start:23925 stop:24260 length:336 start_codon:yes stop_codon:yes gene_type:complete
MALSNKLKEEAKALGIKSYWSYNEDTLKKKIAEIKGSTKSTKKSSPKPGTYKKSDWTEKMDAIMKLASEGQAKIMNAKKEIFVSNAQWRSAMLDKASYALNDAYKYINKIK